MTNPGVLSSVLRLRVLVVDDNADSADTLALLLDGWGHEAQVAYSGSKALQFALAAPPAAILSDIGMPGMTGYDLARRLRKDSHFQRTTLIAITGYGSAEARSMSRAAGFDHHFTKPVEPDVLQELLQTIGENRNALRDDDETLYGR